MSPSATTAGSRAPPPRRGGSRDCWPGEPEAVRQICGADHHQPPSGRRPRSPETGSDQPAGHPRQRAPEPIGLQLHGRDVTGRDADPQRVAARACTHAAGATWPVALELAAAPAPASRSSPYGPAIPALGREEPRTVARPRRVPRRAPRVPASASVSTAPQRRDVAPRSAAAASVRSPVQHADRAASRGPRGHRAPGMRARAARRAGPPGRVPSRSSRRLAAPAATQTARSVHRRVQDERLHEPRASGGRNLGSAARRSPAAARRPRPRPPPGSTRGRHRARSGPAGSRARVEQLRGVCAVPAAGGRPGPQLRAQRATRGCRSPSSGPVPQPDPRGDLRHHRLPRGVPAAPAGRVHDEVSVRERPHAAAIPDRDEPCPIVPGGRPARDGLRVRGPDEQLAPGADIAAVSATSPRISRRASVLRRCRLTSATGGSPPARTPTRPRDQASRPGGREAGRAALSAGPRPPGSRARPPRAPAANGSGRPTPPARPAAAPASAGPAGARLLVPSRSRLRRARRPTPWTSDEQHEGRDHEARITIVSGAPAG